MIPRWVIPAVIAFLMATYIAGYAWGAAIQDTARDVFYAYSIRHGHWFPLEGPILGGVIGLGPAWFYLLAVPLLLWDSWLAVALFVAVLGSLKFPLALACGTRLVDRNFGLLWAACLAIPGWSHLEPLFFFNANPAAAVVLAALWLGLRIAGRAPSGVELFACGVACALALHVHPTTAPVVLLGAWALRKAWSALREWARPVALLALGFVVPLVPYLVSQAVGGALEWGGASGYVQTQVSRFEVASVPMVLWGQLWGGPRIIATYAGIPAAPAAAIAIATMLPLAGTALLVVRGNAYERLLTACLVAGAVVFATWIALLRPTTPSYFLYCLAPLTSALIALGLWRWMRGRAGRAIVAACIVLLLAGHVAMVHGLANRVRAGEGRTSSQILDVKESTPRSIYTDTWFPAAARARLGAMLCAAPSGITLHGHLAYIVDRSVGIDALLECHRVEQVSLMGNLPGAAVHWVGMSRDFWKQLGTRPACRIGSLGIAAPTVVAWPPSGEPVPDGRKYFPRERARTPPREMIVEFEAPPAYPVLVTNVVHGYETLDALAVQADGREIKAVARNDLSALYAPPASVGRSPVKWSVRLTGTRPELVDVVAFDPRFGDGAPALCPPEARP